MTATIAASDRQASRTAGHIGRFGSLAAWAILIIGGATVVLGQGRHISIFADDELFLGQAREMHLSWKYLRLGLFEHFSPVSRLGDKVMASVLPGHHWALLAGMAVIYLGFAGAAVLVARTIAWRPARYPEAPALVVAVAIGVPLTALPLVNWWTAGLNIMPAVTGVLLALAGTIRLVRGGTLLWGCLALGGYLLAVLDYELAMLAPAYGALWVLLFASSRTAEPLRSMIRRTAWLWAGFALIGAAALYNYMAFYYVKAPHARFGVVARGVGESLLYVQVPALLGFWNDHLEPGLVAGAVAAWAIVAALCVLTVRRSRRALRGWAFAALGWFVPSAGLIYNRAGYSPVYGWQLVYYLLPTALVVVGIVEAAGAAWSPGIDTAGSSRPPLEVGGGFRPGVAVATGVTVAVITLCGWVTSAHRADRYLAFERASNSYLSRFASSLRHVGGPGRISVLDSNVPPAVVFPQFFPYNRVSKVLPLWIGPVPVGVYPAPLYAVGPDGGLVGEHLVVDRQVDLTVAKPAALTLSGVTALTPEPCFRASPGGSVQWRPTTPPGGSGDQLVAAAFTTDAPLRVSISLQALDGSTVHPYPVTESVRRGTSGVLVQTTLSQVGAVQITFPLGATKACIKSIVLGAAGPVAAPSS